MCVRAFIQVYIERNILSPSKVYIDLHNDNEKTLLAGARDVQNEGGRSEGRGRLKRCATFKTYNFFQFNYGY